MKASSTSLAISATDAMVSPHLFGPFFTGPSWGTWRAVVKALFAEPMTSVERVLFDQVAGGRKPPPRRVRRAVAAVGRGGGKGAIASFLASHIAVTFDPKGRLRPGERAVVVCLACDRGQAAIVFGYIKGYFEAVPALKALVTHWGADSLDLRNNVTIEVHTNSFRGVRGKTLLCVIFDEVAFWRDENSANPDIEMDIATAPGLARVQDSMLIMISSVHKRAGLLYSNQKTLFGKDIDDALMVMGGTMVFNPSFDEKIITRDLETDPERFGAEYCCRWRDDLASFITRELLDACTDRGVVVRSPQAGVQYVAAVDVSGGRGDEFTWAIAHRERDGTVVLDVTGGRKPPFNPTDVVGEVVQVMKAYRCHSCTGDSYGAEWVVEAFAKAGAKYVKSEYDRSASYINCLPLFTSGRARLLDNAKLISQFAALERRTFSTGRESISPGPGHDDRANSAAIAMSHLALKKAPMKITPELLARARMPSSYGPGSPAARGLYGGYSIGGGFGGVVPGSVAHRQQLQRQRGQTDSDRLIQMLRNDEAMEKGKR